MRKSNLKRKIVSAAVGALTAASFVQAGTTVWSGASGVDTNWSTAANWSGGEPGSADRAVIRVNSALSPVVTQAGENCYTMDIAWGTSSVGLLTIESGDLTVNSTGIALELGGVGNGTIVQTGGALTVNGYTTLGGITSGITGGSGTYNLSDGTLNSKGQFSVGCRGTGTFIQSGGTVNGSVTTFIGRGNAGSYSMSCGTLNLGTTTVSSADALWVGYGGPGAAFTQSGGTVNTYGKVTVGQGTTATYSMTGGALNLADNTSLVVGGTGTGTFLMGDACTSGSIGKIGTGTTSLWVNDEFKGWGEVDVRYIYNSGKVISDGYGNDRLLDMGDSERVLLGSTPGGWYAVNGGGVILPSLRFSGAATQTWGGDLYGATPTLVNSASITLTNDCKGNIDGALLAADRSDLSSMIDANADIIGLWDFAVGLDATSPSTDLSNSTVAIRYDDALAATLGLDESALEMYQYINGSWTALNAFVDTTTHTITATTDSFSFFAVGQNVPEPMSLGLLSLGVLALIRRRK